MRTTLRLTIQLAWVYLGFISGYALVGLTCSVLLGHVQLPFTHGDWVWRISNTSVAVAGLAILVLIIWCAWQALFRFPTNILGPTVFLASLVMIFTAFHGEHQYLQPWINADIHRHRFSVAPIISLGLTLAVLAGWTMFIYRMPILLEKVLYSNPVRRTKVANA